VRAAAIFLKTTVIFAVLTAAPAPPKAGAAPRHVGSTWADPLKLTEAARRRSTMT
jgi:hypothetical protein